MGSCAMDEKISSTLWQTDCLQSYLLILSRFKLNFYPSYFRIFTRAQTSNKKHINFIYFLNLFLFFIAIQHRFSLLARFAYELYIFFWLLRRVIEVLWIGNNILEELSKGNLGVVEERKDLPRLNIDFI